MRLNAIENGAGTPVVFLHGLFGNARNLAGVQRPLADRYRTIALDLRNHGDSPHHAEMTYATMADDVAETLRDLSVQNCVLVGHSMGGKVAMRLALTNPDLVAQLAVLDIAPITYSPAFRSYASAMQTLHPATGATRADLHAALATSVPDAGIRAFLMQNINFSANPPRWKIGLNEIAAALPEIESWPAVEGTYTGPTIFLAGEKSDYITLESRPVIQQLFPAARFVRIRNAGHWVHADAPDAVSATLAAFIDPS